MSFRFIPSLSSPTSSVRTPIAVVVVKFLGGSPDGSGTDVGLWMGAVVEDFAPPAESVVAYILGTALAG
jgi:hypothetical protein